MIDNTCLDLATVIHKTNESKMKFKINQSSLICSVEYPYTKKRNDPIPLFQLPD